MITAVDELIEIVLGKFDQWLPAREYVYDAIEKSSDVSRATE
jgi:hypothetical protein